MSALHFFSDEYSVAARFINGVIGSGLMESMDDFPVKFRSFNR